jgi:dethiobiotin synthetase
MKIYFVTAIHTDSGKTLVSAILTQALQADYWKPVQAGRPRDTDTVLSLVSNEVSVFHNEAYLLNASMSPHAAARLEHVYIHLSDILLPNTKNQTLVVEGAGGVLVPINDEHFMIDLAEKFKAETVLVANTYLGSINHTLLTAQELKRRNLPVKGIVFNGETNGEAESIILHHTGYPCLLRIHPEKAITKEVVNQYALELLENLRETGQSAQ